jgi:hypothetical protein
VAARRCSLCGISYPAMNQFTVCPVHEEATQWIEKDPDEDWKPTMDRLLQRMEQSKELTRVIPLVRGIEPYTENGLLWINQTALFQAGGRFNSAWPDFHLFELEDGWVYETQGWDDSRRR